MDDVAPSTRENGCNEESCHDPLPIALEGIGALALVQRFFGNVRDCGFSCPDPLDNVEKFALSRAVRLFKQKMPDYFV